MSKLHRSDELSEFSGFENARPANVNPWITHVIRPRFTQYCNNKSTGVDSVGGISSIYRLGLSQ
jgi:hypothetical protein